MNRGQLEYEYGALPLRVAFPKGAVCCKNCWLCVDDPRMKMRKVCSATMEILYDVNLIGDRCPIDFGGETDVSEFEG